MKNSGLSSLDWIVIAVFLVAVLVLGLKSAGRQRTTRDYFLGGRSLPWWAVALSIIATETSAVTFYGTPGSAYRTSWFYLQIVLGFMLARIFIAFYMLKVYYRAEVITVYGFLQKRFGEGVRITAALLFLFGRVIGSAVRLFAACIALRVAAGWAGDQATLIAIVILGLLALAYTLMGGIKAVVWAESILGSTFILGGLLAVGILLYKLLHLPGGLEEVAALPEFAGKLRIFHFSASDGAGWLSSSEPLWIGLGGGFVLCLATHGTDQDMVQRMLTCSDSKQGGRSLMASAALILPLNLIFLTVGSLLYFYHRLHPAAQPAGVENADDYFLLFIANEIPQGLAGLVLAGLFAAAVSSHTSVLNALSSTTLADFYRPHLRPGKSESHYLLASRLFTAMWGIVLILAAAAFIGSTKNILMVALGVLTYFYGSLLGVFLLGIFTRRGSSASATVGMLAAVPVVLLLQLRDFIENLEKAPISVRGLISALPDGLVETVREGVPLLAWPLWIVVGTAVTFIIGALGRGKPFSGSPAGEGAESGKQPKGL